jgi:hypothetical protein
VAPSLTRGWVCNLLVQLLLGLARAVTLGSKSRRTHDHILQSHLRLPQEQGDPVIPPGTGFPFITSYDSQRYGGGILTRLHTGMTDRTRLVLLKIPQHAPNRKHLSSVSVPLLRSCLLPEQFGVRCCIATYFRCRFLVTGLHVTI